MLAGYPKVDKVFNHDLTSTSQSLPLDYQFQLEERSWTLPDPCSSVTVPLSKTPPSSSNLSQQDSSKTEGRATPSCFLRIPCGPVMDISPDDDLQRISRCLQLLQLSGYYYEGLSWQQASVKLRSCRVGTFLVRESENANFLFTLSVQTKKGPTSIRIAYKGGMFRFDSDDELVPQMPVFATVTDLVEYYVTVSRSLTSQTNNSGCFWCDLDGEWRAPVELYYPLYTTVHSLKHLCRLEIGKYLKSGARNTFNVEKKLALCATHLPSALVEYVKEYTHIQ